MILARVTGSVTSTDKDPELADYKLLVVQPLDLEDAPDGEELIAVDRVDAGVGDKVLVVKEGNAARQITGRDRVPLQAIVVGVVDHVDWLDGHDIPYWDLCFLADKAAVGADLYVEDSPANIEHLRSHGHRAIVFTSSTNRHLPGPRADTWDEVYAMVREEIARKR